MLFLLIISIHSLMAQDTQTITKQMLHAIEQNNEMTFTMESKERFNGKMKSSKVSVKLIQEPLQIYLFSHYPQDGAEILYRHGKDNNKAIINPNGFPYFNIWMSPFNSKMRKGQHHAIIEIGFKLLADMVKENLTSNPNFIEYKGKENFEGKSCFKLEMNADRFTYKTYTLKESLSTYDIASQKGISEQLIREKNKISTYGKLSKGTSLMIPTAYAQRVVLYLDQNTYLPVGQILEDDQGVFEWYHFMELNINPNFAKDEFTSSYSEYGF